jgi:acyl-CoA thioester hydrolase
MEKFLFSVPIQIRMSDLDPFVHVNNGAQCNLFDYGRSAYFETVFGGQIDWTQLDLVLVHVELDFLLPVKYHESVVCETKIYEIGNKSLKMIQQLRNTDNNVIKTQCKSVLAGFDRKLNISLPIKEIYKEKIIAFEKGEVLFLS